jgi:hypothetical protein
MLRLLVTAVVAVGLHAGIGLALFKAADRMERPLTLRTRLVSKTTLEGIERQVEALRRRDCDPSISEEEVQSTLRNLGASIAQLQGELEGDAPSVALARVVALGVLLETKKQVEALDPCPREIVVSLEELHESIEELDEPGEGTTELAMFELPPASPPEPPPAEKVAKLPSEWQVPVESVPEPIEPPPVEAQDVLTVDEAPDDVLAAPDEKAAKIAKQLAQLDVETVGVLGGDGVAVDGVLSAGDVPTGLLDDAAGSPDGVVMGDSAAPGSGGRGLKALAKPKRGASRTGAAVSSKKKKKKKKKGRVLIGKVSAGGLEAKRVKRILRRARGRLRRCYRDALETNPDAAGTIRLSLQIDETGQVVVRKRTREVVSDISPRSVASCMAGVAHGLAFPAPDDGEATVAFSVRVKPD